LDLESIADVVSTDLEDAASPTAEAERDVKQGCCSRPSLGLGPPTEAALLLFKELRGA
jgi:hypothetical protein